MHALRRVSAFFGAAAPLGCVIFIRMLIAPLVGSVANFPVLWYDKFNKSEFAMRRTNYIVKNLYTFF